MLNILLFHKLDDEGREHETVSRRVFEACLDRVGRGKVATVADWAAGSGAGCALTFDDGYESDHSVALPALAQRGLRGTFFLVTSRIGQAGRVTAAQARALSDAGMELGSHTHTHPYLPEVSDAELRRELTVSKDILEQLAGRPVTTLSIPGGELDGRLLEAARLAGYRQVCSSRPGLNALPLSGLLRRNALHRFHTADGVDAALNPTLLSEVSYEARGLAKRLLGPRNYVRLRDRLLGSREDA